MLLEIITPEKTVLKEEIEELTAPTEDGYITVLPHHVNLLTQLAPGELIATVKGKKQHLAVMNGFLKVQKNDILILADYAIHSDEIDTQKALEAQKRAEETLKKKEENISESDLALAQGEMRKAILELKVARRRRESMMPK